MISMNKGGFDKKHSVRGAGILLPISSLPGLYGIGTMGASTRRFVDFLRIAGQRYWQILPIGPTDEKNSPYQSPAAFAGNYHLIDLEELCREGLLEEEEPASFSWGERPDRIDYQKIEEYRLALLHKAYTRYTGCATDEYGAFCREQEFWLEDYALFMAIKSHFNGEAWQKWEEGARNCRPAALELYRELLREEIDFWRFVQFQFSRQWLALKEYANAAGIYVIGDIPLYVSGDSADCWAHRAQFLLDSEGYPAYVGGVPPDEFSQEGQNWNSPVYDWARHRREDFAWWRSRMTRAAELYDLIRIDHFIGLSHYFCIPGLNVPAASGQWRSGPGEALLHAITLSVPAERLIAEDLGDRKPETDKLLETFRIPGMKVLQFAFNGSPDNAHLPHNYGNRCVVYGGTHDNEPLAAFYENNPEARKCAARYLNRRSDRNLVWETIRLGMASTADVAIFQIQDYLCFGNEARINRPGTVGFHNWTWRLIDGRLTPQLARKIFRMTRLYGR